MRRKAECMPGQTALFNFTNLAVSEQVVIEDKDRNENRAKKDIHMLIQKPVVKGDNAAKSRKEHTVEEYTNLVMQYKDNHVISSICTIPAADGNFISAVERAEDGELTTALNILRSKTKGNLGRITAVKKELKKRNLSSVSSEDLQEMIQALKGKWNGRTLNEIAIEDHMQPSMSECEMSKQAKMFAKQLIAFIGKMAEKNQWTADIRIGYYMISGFLKSEEGKYAYMSYNIARDDEPIDLMGKSIHTCMLVRSAKNNKDYTGGNNTFTSIYGLERRIMDAIK